MKIFISWSQPQSEKIAYLLKDFIINVFDDNKDEKLSFFISAQDIYSGDKWFDKICEELYNSDYAIICLTKENKFSKWLDFESGAASFNSKNAPVSPFLINIEKLEPNHPLNNYQCTYFNETSVYKLMRSINLKLNCGIREKHLKATFNQEFSTFRIKVEEVINSDEPFTEIEHGEVTTYPTNINRLIKNKIFIGMPMASIDPKVYSKKREKLLVTIDILKKVCQTDKIYSPVIDSPNSKDFDGKEKAVELNFSELKSSEYYVFIYPEKVASSILIEIGYAIALRKKTLIFVKNRCDLPFMLERFDRRNNYIRIYDYKNFDDLNDQLNKDGKFMFEFNEKL